MLFRSAPNFTCTLVKDSEMLVKHLSAYVCMKPDLNSGPQCPETSQTPISHLLPLSTSLPSSYSASATLYTDSSTGSPAQKKTYTRPLPLAPSQAAWGCCRGISKAFYLSPDPEIWQHGCFPVVRASVLASLLSQQGEG